MIFWFRMPASCECGAAIQQVLASGWGTLVQGIWDTLKLLNEEKGLRDYAASFFLKTCTRVTDCVFLLHTQGFLCRTTELVE